jgi:serine/threonine protein phosphatase PrpC
MDPTTPAPLRLRYAALSDVGRVRKDNQDSGFASEHLLVVADGVGGAARGDIASATAVQMIQRLDEPPASDLLEALAGAVHRAHDRIAELVEQDPELEGTSTTVTAALFDGAAVGVAHIGDSRGYLLRDGQLSQLTKDHTFVQSLIDEGRITEDDARTHPHRNLILRAVDGVHETDPDLFVVDLAPGDRILLCSDGCSGVLDNARLSDILGSGTVDYAVVELIRSALEAGSSDNVTCVVADVTDAAGDGGDSDHGATTGAILVGAAAEQPRRAGAASKSFFRGHRSGDTGELEPVPAVDDDLDPEELRYAPRPPRRFVWLRRLTTLAVLVLVAAVLAFFGYRWTQDQYYVAAHNDKVAVYRGIQADVPGLTMHRLAKETKVTLESLPAYRAEQVRGGIDADNLQQALGIVSRLTGLAIICPTPSTSPSTNPSSGSSSGPSSGPSASPSGQASSPAPTRGTKSPSGGRTTKKPSSGSTTQGGKHKSSTSPSPSPSPSSKPTIKPPNCIRSVS